MFVRGMRFRNTINDGLKWEPKDVEAGRGKTIGKKNFHLVF